APFISEYLYRNLTEEESVHLVNWPKADLSVIDSSLEEAMQIARKVTEEGHAKRKEDNIKVKIPIGRHSWQSLYTKTQLRKVQPEIWDIILKELNAKNILINESKDKESIFFHPIPPVPFTQEELDHEGEIRELVREIQGERKKLNCHISDLVSLVVPEKFKNDLEYIKKKVLAKDIQLGEKVEIAI
ncbi:MAG: class I tRNA ligase family protein, partial [Patescibacteria group bacterium]